MYLYVHMHYLYCIRIYKYEMYYISVFANQLVQKAELSWVERNQFISKLW